MHTMLPLAIGFIVFACAFGGFLAGMLAGRRLPESHRSKESRDTIHTGIALVATMTALVLGLITASAKESFDTVDKTVRRAAADILTIDRELARYGPESDPIRATLRLAVEHKVLSIWRRDAIGVLNLDPRTANTDVESLVSEIRSLVPLTEEQTWLRTRAIERTEALLEVRYQILGRFTSSVPTPFLVILVFWLTVAFTSFGLFAPRNATVTTAILVCALSVAAAVFLVLELDGPFHGLIAVTPEPLLRSLALLQR
jgi:hypothetical protein